MPFTPEQKDHIREAHTRGDDRVTLGFTMEQRAQWQQAVREELACKAENSAHYQKIVAAAEQAGFFGDIRRAMLVSRRPISELATTIGVQQRLLSDFRAAEAELPAAALNRLVGALGLRLMQEIQHE